jgi:hypothetical protein
MNSRFGGRPKLPPNQTRDQRVVTFLTGDERKLLEKIADDANVSVSRACHDLIIRGMDQADTLRPDTRAEQGAKK